MLDLGEMAGAADDQPARLVARVAGRVRQGLILRRDRLIALFIAHAPDSAQGRLRVSMPGVTKALDRCRI